jgi:ribosomal protein L12E/L44/L45/RPP1/RPP2
MITMKFTKAALVASLTALTFAAPACDKKEEAKKDDAAKKDEKKDEKKEEAK